MLLEAAENVKAKPVSKVLVLIRRKGIHMEDVNAKHHMRCFFQSIAFFYVRRLQEGTLSETKNPPLADQDPFFRPPSNSFATTV